ncbi:hypothetical protein G6F70_005019 [Rhizopus microsporus]|nr:hypothetical protein G6F71_004935 [Rhizopus microsporus]KAG1199341.1 hypothetical protein G6F70_005019 [Rhizopus microsporus]KAG1211280.1 hypothetical protein G6F69_004738 [Rhizopus microsporus]KAG1233106.1 hypothetical protein G6F67_004518 [Rhizopus microsporus]KAG1264228.1 hypothetical protein G6F68_004525 [Rhizopus microsporus]
MHGFGKSLELKINVLSDEVVLLGQPQEAAGKMLQGTLSLNVNEPIKVKSINLSFIGKMKVSWSEGVGHQQHFHKQERTIISHHWEFVGNEQKKSQVLNAGKYNWVFELMLPGDLPQTLDSDVGSNTVKKKVIKVLRSVLPSEFELIQSLEIHNTWAEKMVYDISVPSKLYAFNDKIPITFKILPIASQLKVHALMASIKEYCTYTANDHTKTDTRIIRLIRQDSPFVEPISVERPTWEKTLSLEVPSKSPMVFADADSDMIRIRHRLKFVISLVNADGHISELRCAVQIIVVESFVAAQEMTTLPAYDEMWRSVPYDPSVVERLRARSISEAGNNEPPLLLPESDREPVTISGWSRLLSVSQSSVPTAVSCDQVPHSQPVAIPGSNSGSRHHSRRPSVDEQDLADVPLNELHREDQVEEEHHWWDEVDLGKVPSYRTVGTNLFPYSLPPAYDSVSNRFDHSPANP